MNKLQFLLQRSQVYSKIMSDKMKREKEAREKRESRDEKKLEESKVENGVDANEPASNGRITRAGDTNDKKDILSAPKRTQRGAAKRRGDEEKYNISDYIDQEEVKKQEIKNESKVHQANDKVTTRFKQPALITGATLRDYQLYGVEWLVGLYENGLNGILADEMGLGKTLQTIAFLAHLKSKQQYGPFLVVCPASTIQNWMDEVAKFAPEMKALLYYSHDKKQRKKWVDQYRHEPKTADAKRNFPIFVTSYEIAINDSKMLGSMRWKFIVVDEGHRLKNKNARLTKELKSYYSANRLILTGTPVHNNLAELWSLLNFILPDVFDNLEEFERWFDFSDLNSEGGSAKLLSREQSQSIITTLRDILDPFILQREKKHVEKDLPPKKEYMLYAPLTIQQKELYQEVLNNSIRARLTEMMTDMTWEEIQEANVLQGGEGWDQPLRIKEAEEKKGASNGISNGTLASKQDSKPNTPSKKENEEKTAKKKKKRAREETLDERSLVERRKPRKSRRSNPCYHIAADQRDSEFMKRMESGEISEDEEPRALSLGDIQRQAKEHSVREAEKSINNMKLQNPIMQLRKICGHPFLFYWPKDRETGEPLINEDLINASGKLLMLNRLLDALWSRGHKVLLFSQFTTMLDIIEEWAEDYKGVRTYRIDGNVAVQSRSVMMKKFNTETGPDACKLFLLSTRAGGLGVNLVAADTVIFFDTDWNPQMDRQAQDRAHRIGQTKPVLVFRLVSRDTAEERIVKRAFAKQQLSTLVLSGDQFSKQTTEAASAFAGKKSKVEEWTALLEDLKRETIDFDIADKNSKMISDEDLEVLLDRSPSTYEKRGKGWKKAIVDAATTGGKAAGALGKGASKRSSRNGIKAAFEVSNVHESDDDVDEEKITALLGDE
jgi:ATP-dependent DNA helicase